MQDDDGEEPAPSRSAASGTARAQTAAEIAVRLQAIELDPERHRLFANKITGSGRALRGDTGEPDDDDDEPDDGDDGGDIVEADEEPKSKSKGPPKPGAKVKYTPLEQQYLEVKAKYPDTVLFVEAGYRYRFFGKDAEVASKVLGIMSSWSHNFLTSSIPTQRLHVHARRIVQAGYKVGVVSQTETAALKKAGSNKSGPFARALTGLYTKGTMVGGDIDPLLVGDVNLGNFLLALVEEPSQLDASRVRISIAAVKTSTGEIIWDTFEDSFLRNELETRLRHIRPIEIVFPSNLSEPSKKLVRIFQVESKSDTTVAPSRSSNAQSETNASSKLDGVRIEEISPSKFDAEKALQTVESIPQNSTTASTAFLRALPRLMLQCIGGLVGYLKDFGLANLFCLECNYVHFSETSRMRLDGRTLDNLELIRNQTNGSHKGSLLWILDRTRSVFGKRLLASWLQHPLTDPQSIIDRQDAVDELTQGDIPARVMLLLDLLPTLPDLERGITRVYYNRCSVEEFLAVLKGFRSVAQAAVTPEQINETVRSPLLRRLLGTIKPELAEEIDSFLDVINPGAKSADKHNVFHPDKEHLFPKIAACRARIKEIEVTLDEHLVQVRKQLGMPKLQYITKSNEDFVLEIEKAYVKKVPSQWHKISATKAVERYHTPTVREQLVFLEQEKEKLQLESMSAWAQLLSRFSGQYSQLRDVISSLAQLDCLFSLVNVAKQDGYVRPKITQDGVLNIVGGRHPIVEALLPEPFVPNDTDLSADGHTCAILTGPNMGGKTSYARQVALIAIMAQIGSFVPAQQAAITPLDAILTRMGAADDEIRGHSTFFVELQETAEILRTATDRSLVILDELGRGTSTYDGFAIAYSTLHFILSSINCFTLFVTHYPGLSQFENLFPNRASNWHMGFLLNETATAADTERPVITFLYKLASGVEPRSYGLNVARLAQLPTNVIAVAEDRSSHLEQEVWSRTLASSLRAVVQNADLVGSPDWDATVLQEIHLQIKSALAARRT
eukprot:TRINITY_DN1269_c0_g1_i2.p1 TRINITY_DN1269_c0_g1~~TRINITY_DN1269_c0_g1_i2.p1  ORF type:complete len:1013 (-),score=154.35 TRINITY_DN1269_c0_g1_i2:17-3055(-)